MANENKTTIIIDAKDTSAAAFNKFTQNLSAAERNMSGFGKGLSGTTAAITQMFNPMMMLSGGIVAAVAGIGALVSKSIDAADKMNKMSQKTGISTEELSKLKYAAELADVPIDALEGSLVKFSKAIYAASDGASEQGKIFKQLGIPIKEANGTFRDTDKVLLDLAERFAAAPDGPGKAALALKLFGKSGADMIPFLNSGKEGITKLTTEAKSLGLELSKKSAQGAEDFNDRMTTLKASLTGAALQIINPLMPSLAGLATEFNEEIIPAIGGATSGIITLVGKIGGLTTTILEFANSPAGNYLLKLGSMGASLAFQKDTYDLNKDYKQGLGSGKKSKEEIDQVKKMYEQGIAYVPGEGYVHLIATGKNDNTKKTNDYLSAFNGPAGKGGGKDKEKKSPYDRTWDVPGEEGFTGKGYMFINGAWIKQELVEAGELFRKNIEDQNTANDAIKQQAGLDLFAQQAALQQTDLENERRIAEEKIALDKMVQDSKIQTLSNMSSAMLMFSQQGTGLQKAAFIASKGFALAEIYFSASSASMAALMLPPIGLGPIAGIPLSTSIWALAAARAGAVLAQSMGGGGGGGGSISAPSSSTPSAPTSSNSNNNQQQTITHTTNIIVYGSVVDHEKFARDISPALENAVRDGSSKLVISG